MQSDGGRNDRHDARLCSQRLSNPEFRRYRTSRYYGRESLVATRVIESYVVRYGVFSSPLLSNVLISMLPAFGSLLAQLG